MRATATMLVILSILLIFCLISCGGDDDDDDSPDLTDGDDDDDDSADDDTVDDDDTDDLPCDATLRPMVFVHGFIEVGDAFANQTLRFSSNNYCMDRIYAFDWNTLGSVDNAEVELTLYVDQVLEETGAEQIDLMGHSMGGYLSLLYMNDGDNAAKVAHYAHLASFSGDLPGGVSAINIGSYEDTMAGVSELEGAESIIIDGLDHLQVATSEETFIELYSHFTDGATPETTEIIPQDEVFISGRAVVIGFNDPIGNFLIEAWRVDPETGERKAGEPDTTMLTDPFGNWGPIPVDPTSHYEFVCKDTEGAQPAIHYYREPFIRSNNKVYFRLLPQEGFLSRLVPFLPFSDQYMQFAWLGLNRAVVEGRDTFTMNGIDLVASGVADPEITTIALFFIDANFNGISDETVAGGIFESFPFLRFFDYRLEVAQGTPATMIFNGRKQTMRNIPSKSQGLSIAVFD